MRPSNIEHHRGTRETSIFTTERTLVTLRELPDLVARELLRVPAELRHTRLQRRTLHFPGKRRRCTLTAHKSRFVEEQQDFTAASARSVLAQPLSLDK